MKRRTFGGVDGRGLGESREGNAGGGRRGNKEVAATVTIRWMVRECEQKEKEEDEGGVGR